MYVSQDSMDGESWNVFGFLDELNKAEALFSFEKISNFATVAHLFVCDKYCPIID